MYTVTLIPGDGIGPEISESVQAIFQAAKVLPFLSVFDTNRLQSCGNRWM